MLADYSKLGEELGYKEAVLLGVSQWDIVGIPEGTIIDTNLGNDEYNSFVISKCDTEVINEGNVTGLKNNIKYCAKLWNKVVSLD